MNRFKTISVIMGLTGTVAVGLLPGGSDIDPQNKYCWGETIGWMNWRDANGVADGVVVGELEFLSGNLWGENIGWVNVGNGSGPYLNTDATDFGVNIAANGDLSGFAWGENIGWVNFDTNVADPDQARFDMVELRFRGYAWSENAGWINLDDAEHFVGLGAQEPCVDNEECATDPEATFCTFDSCVDGQCVFTPAMFGDVAGVGGSCGPDGDVGLPDILAVLDGFGGSFRAPCTHGNIDIGGAQGSCVPDGIIALADILHVLDAFSGISSCGAICDAGGSAMEPPPVSRSAQRRSRSALAAVFTLVPTMPIARNGELIEVEVFVSGAPDVRGYQLAVEAVVDAPSSGHRVRVELVDVSIDTTRTDYVLHGVEHVAALDATYGRLAAATYTGGVTVSDDDAYVGTFTFRASSDAAGLVRFDVRSADTTVLDSTGGSMAIESSSASISVGPASDGRVGSKPIRRGRR